MNMALDLRTEVLLRLEQHYGLKRRPNTGYLRGGKCPACGKNELYAHYANPWLIICGREGKCSQIWHVKELYEDLFDDWSKRAPATDQHPNATARAYLEFARGFRFELVQGWFTQDSFYSTQLDAGSATVRFALEKGGYWERLIDRPQRFGKMKARFKPHDSYKGVWWCPPCVDLLQVKELWIVEGIFDAIALVHHDIAAVSAMSSNAFPEASLKELSRQRGGKLPKLIWALDNEPGAHRYTKRWVRLARDLGYVCEAAQIPQPDSRKLDWNDLHQRWVVIDEPSKRAERVNKDLRAARYHGSLLIAESAAEKGVLMYEWRELHEFHFEFDNRLYWFTMDFDKFNRAMLALESSALESDQRLNERQRRDKALRQCGGVVEIADCYPQALYFQRNEVTDESWYYFRIDFPHDGPSVKSTFTGGQVSTAPEFKKRLLSMAAGPFYTGNSKQLNKIMKEQLFGLKTVETIDFIGYSKQHGSYVFSDIAVRNGVVSEVNQEDYFEFGKLRLKTLQKSNPMHIQRDAKEYREDWLPMLWTCFGANGLVALTFWFGSLFAEQIRAQYKSFPFLEATGEAGAGKTTLLTFLWKLLGQEKEGFDPSKSTRAGRQRAMGQVSNMPVVLIEGDRNEPDKLHAKGFDWDELKEFFGGGTLGTKGMKTSGNETYEPPFRATIAISQNAAVSASEAILTRIVKLHFARPAVTTESRIAADNLNQIPVEQLSHFLLKAIRAEPQVIARFAERVVVHEERLRKLKDIRVERIIKNHSQMLALLDCLRLVCPLDENHLATTQQQLTAMALERQSAISADHPLVAEFWEVYEYLESLGEGPQVNHSADPKLIAIHLNGFVKLAREHHQNVTDLKVLRPLLENSRSRKLVDINKATYSVVRASQAAANPLQSNPKTLRCWVFQSALSV